MGVFVVFIGSIGAIGVKMRRKIRQNNQAVMGIEQTTKITTVYI